MKRKKDEYSKKRSTIVDDLFEESTIKDEEFTIDGIDFKPASKLTSKDGNTNAGINENHIAKQINDLHKLNFSETESLSEKELANKIKAQILLKDSRRTKKR